VARENCELLYDLKTQANKLGARAPILALFDRNLDLVSHFFLRSPHFQEAL